MFLKTDYLIIFVLSCIVLSRIILLYLDFFILVHCQVVSPFFFFYVCLCIRYFVFILLSLSLESSFFFMGIQFPLIAFLYLLYLFVVFFPLLLITL